MIIRLSTLMLMGLFVIGDCFAENPEAKSRESAPEFTDVLTREGKVWKPCGVPVKEQRNAQGTSLEIGVCIFPSARILETAKRLQETFHGPQITPHITLIQGLFDPIAYKRLLSLVKEIADTQHPVPLQMTSTPVVVGVNIFWDVQPETAGYTWLNKLNESLTEKTSPVGRMWQVVEDMKDNTDEATAVLVERHGRDFNVPGHNRPHITVVYGPVQEEKKQRALSLTLAQEDLNPHMPQSIAICQIDCQGNIAKVIENFLF